MAYSEILNYTRKFLEYMFGSNFSDACPKMLVGFGILEVSKGGWRIKAGGTTITRGLLMPEEKNTIWTQSTCPDRIVNYN